MRSCKRAVVDGRNVRAINHTCRFKDYRTSRVTTSTERIERLSKLTSVLLLKKRSMMKYLHEREWTRYQDDSAITRNERTRPCQ